MSGDWDRDRCPDCGGSLRATDRKIQTSNGGHHVRPYVCGECGRRVGR